MNWVGVCLAVGSIVILLVAMAWTQSSYKAACLAHGGAHTDFISGWHGQCFDADGKRVFW